MDNILNWLKDFTGRGKQVTVSIVGFITAGVALYSTCTGKEVHIDYGRLAENIGLVLAITAPIFARLAMMRQAKEHKEVIAKLENTVAISSGTIIDLQRDLDAVKTASGTNVPKYTTSKGGDQ